MTSYPEFDPLHAPEDPAAVDLPNPFADEDEPPSLEGVLFCSYLTEEDLTGANWDRAAGLPALPASLWEEPPLPDEAVMRAMAAARFETRAIAQPRLASMQGPAVPSQPVADSVAIPPTDSSACLPAEPGTGHVREESLAANEERPASPPLSRLESASKFTRELLPPGSGQTGLAAADLYGDLADMNWLHSERLKSAAAEPEMGLVSTGPESSKLGPAQLQPMLTEATAPHRISSVVLSREEEMLSVVEQASSPDEFCREESASSSEAGGRTRVEPAAFADAEAAPQLQEGLIEILAFQPKRLSDTFDPVAAAKPEENDLPLFQAFYEPAPRMGIRIPHFGHLALLVLLGFTGLVGSMLLTRAALHLHLWGVATAEKAGTDIHYTIGFMAGIYLITFALAALLFPLWWHRSLFSGLQWNAAGAGRRIGWLVGAACVCFVLALVDQIVLPGPTNAPIDKMFDSRTAAWLLLVFGVTFAPFFEEIVFRGFLLPALCTAFDWYGEKLTGNPPAPLDDDGHPQWSVTAMVLAAICTSIPFAGMHAEQTGYSIGPFVLLVAVSLVLCGARLWARSLAASMLVHASYNAMLFSIMLLGTGGFKHLDKM